MKSLKSLRKNCNFFQSASDPLARFAGGSWKESHRGGLSRTLLGEAHQLYLSLFWSVLPYRLTDYAWSNSRCRCPHSCLSVNCDDFQLNESTLGNYWCDCGTVRLLRSPSVNSHIIDDIIEVRKLTACQQDAGDKAHSMCSPETSCLPSQKSLMHKFVIGSKPINGI